MYRQICQNSHSRARCEVIFHTRKLLFAFYSHERPAAIFTNQKSTVAYHGMGRRGEARNIVIERRKDTESMLNRPFVRNKSATHGKKTYDREITVLRETEESARVIVNNEERLAGKKDIGVYDINVVYNVGEFRCNARDNHYVSNVSGRAAANPDFFRPPFLPKSCNVSAHSTRRLGSATFRKFEPHAGLVQLAPGVLERVGIRGFSRDSYNVFNDKLNCKTTSPPGRFEIEHLGDVEFLLDVYRKRDDNPAISDIGNRTPSERLFSRGSKADDFVHIVSSSRQYILPRRSTEC
ncbi:hypothetical protein ALC57_06756 [Trachymyrmex cornetzi]|uniref:Uncharacterized protein n=1 Tax=Trachymyrmex cornetzi TaxID=471704 RepID=A0A195E6M9_9HYME|nr:hypothetical protein ALC57_06756 [Trachymyrmex cornetzi]